MKTNGHSICDNSISQSIQNIAFRLSVLPFHSSELQGKPRVSRSISVGEKAWPVYYSGLAENNFLFFCHVSTLCSLRGCWEVPFSLAFRFCRTNCFILLFSKRVYNSARYSENLFPQIFLTSLNTWPQTHDLQDSVITVLHAKHCWRTMLNLWPAQLTLV